MTDQDESEISASCQKPILPGEGGYRREKGDVHTEYYERSQKKADTVDPRGPKGK